MWRNVSENLDMKILKSEWGKNGISEQYVLIQSEL